jgi:hypothetical protein
VTPNLINFVLYGGLLAVLLWFPRLIARQYRGVFGRSYGLVVSDLYAETERRAQLIGTMAAAREQRIERLERRLEQAR